MKLTGSGNQVAHHPLYTLDGTITTGGTPQLILPQSPSRSLLLLQNTSIGPLYFETGSARAKCAITSGAVSSVTVTNAGFGFTNPPVVRFLGGGGIGATGATPAIGAPFLGGNVPGFPAPSNVAIGHAVLTGGAVSSIVIDNPGSGYLCAPFVFLFDSDLDPFGSAVPSATSGLALASSASFVFNGTCCPTDPVAVYGATTGQSFVARWMD